MGLAAQLAYDAEHVLARLDSAGDGVDFAEPADLRDPRLSGELRVASLWAAVEHDVEITPGTGFYGDACRCWVPAADVAEYGTALTPGRHTGAAEATIVRYPDDVDAAETWRVAGRARTGAWWELELYRLGRPAPRGA